jgi:hypothetical protein
VARSYLTTGSTADVTLTDVLAIRGRQGFKKIVVRPISTGRKPMKIRIVDDALVSRKKMGQAT